MDAVHQGCLGSWNDQVHLVLLSELDEGGVVIALNIGIGDLARGTETSTAVTGGDIDDVDEGRLAQLPSESMLTDIAE